MDRVSVRYASALFQLAEEKGALELFYEEARLIGNALQKDPSFVSLLGHPGLDMPEKEKLLKAAFAGKVSEEWIGCMLLLLRKGHGHEIISFIEAFYQMVRDKNGLTSAHVLSAVPLSGQQTDILRAKLEKNLNKQVEIDAEVDPSILGGLRVQVNGMIIDSSIRRQIEAFKKKLA